MSPEKIKESELLISNIQYNSEYDRDVLPLMNAKNIMDMAFEQCGSANESINL